MHTSTFTSVQTHPEATRYKALCWKLGDTKINSPQGLLIQQLKHLEDSLGLGRQERPPHEAFGHEKLNISLGVLVVRGSSARAAYVHSRSDLVLTLVVPPPPSSSNRLGLKKNRGPEARHLPHYPTAVPH